MTDWIKLSDSKPEVGKFVIVSHNDFVTCTRLVNGWGRSGSGKIYWEGMSSYPIDYFSHWMPMPIPPSKDGS